MNPLVDDFIANAKKWQDEMALLRTYILNTGLTEELKWKQPCYTLNNKNILIISAFKEHCVVSFLKGVLLQDDHKLLTLPGENSQSVMFLKFTSLAQIKKAKATIIAYVYEAIEIEKAGLKPITKDNNSLFLVAELQNKLNNNTTLKKAFLALTPGKQRAYNMFFLAAKQVATREQRIAKSIPNILNGKGLNDCTCGLSQRMPSCDGSHKFLNKK